MWRVIAVLAIAAFARSEYKYVTKEFEVPLDHFGYQRTERFNIRYLEYNDFHKGRGPIFFYTGNEVNADCLKYRLNILKRVLTTGRPSVRNT